MALTDEDARAIAWQQDQIARSQIDLNMAIARRGSNAAYIALVAKTEPLRLAILEANMVDSFNGFDTDEANT